jgi:threonine dehydratase
MEDLERAVAIVRRHVPVTPTYAWPLLAADIGTEVWVKHENTTPTGAFKVRGGLVLVERLARERPDLAGIVSATRGNHGQSLAFAGAVHGVAVTIVVPEGNSADKNAAMVALGARLVVHGVDYQAAREHAQALADEHGLQMVGPFEPDLVLGVATYALELFTAVARLDVVYVPVGMGSGICGLMGVRDLLGLDTEIVGVVAAGAPATLLSFAAGHPVATESADTFVDGVATRVPDESAIALICAGAARIIAVDDDDVREAMRVMHRCTHSAAEPSGALALAGARAERELLTGLRVGLIHSGANADAALVASVLAG